MPLLLSSAIVALSPIVHGDKIMHRARLTMWLPTIWVRYCLHRWPCQDPRMQWNQARLYGLFLVTWSLGAVSIAAVWPTVIIRVRSDREAQTRRIRFFGSSSKGSLTKCILRTVCYRHHLGQASCVVLECEESALFTGAHLRAPFALFRRVSCHLGFFIPTQELTWWTSDTRTISGHHGN
jgi:hypothetical protein